jgi:hypothetical protein
MTRDTFDSRLKGTYLLSATNGAWQVAVENDSAREWLENRLRGTIERTLDTVAEKSVQLQFVVAPAASVTRNTPALDDQDARQPAAPNQKGRTGKTTASPEQKTKTGSLAVDIRALNQTGYQPLTNYYPRFVAPWLRRKWGSAGDKAFILWAQLVAADGRQVTGDSFTNWTPPRSHPLETLAESLSLSVQSLTGRYGYCARFNLQKRAGAPLERCCRPDEPETEFRAGCYCRYWRPGALEVLSDEGMLRVAESGGRKNYRLTLQMWRSWPLLTPRQAGLLLAGQQDQHRQWLAKWQRVTGVTPAQWAAEERDSAIEQFADRESGMECRDLFVRNPFRRQQRL